MSVESSQLRPIPVNEDKRADWRPPTQQSPPPPPPPPPKAPSKS